MTSASDLWVSQTPQFMTLGEAKAFAWDFAAEGTPSSITSLTAYDATGTDVSTALLTGSNSLSGAVATGKKFTPASAQNYRLVMVVVISGNTIYSALDVKVISMVPAARVGMIDLIQEVRDMANAGPGDFDVAGVPAYSDKQIQDVLDRFRTDHFRVQLQAVQSYNNGSVEYKDYYSGVENLEKSTGGTAITYIQTAAGSVVSSSLYTFDYIRGAAAFASDTGGSTYYLYGRSYDLNRAAADIWRRKASYFANQFDFSTDNHSIKKGSVYKHCLEMAEFYEQRAATSMVVTMTRSDMEI
jgi:hypothetical protein